MTEAAPERVWGKHRGIVAANIDPLNLGRLMAFVPGVLAETPTGWATPCAPFAGPTSGFFAVPPVGAGVWIEFEGGDASRPIWSGGYWGAAETPLAPPAIPALPTTQIWRSTFGLSVVLDDQLQTIAVTDATGLIGVKIDSKTATVTVMGPTAVVLQGAQVLEGSPAAAHPAVRGDLLLAYLTQLVTAFNLHVHPGEMAGGFLPVTPALPVAPMPLPPPSLLSPKVRMD